MFLFLSISVWGIGVFHEGLDLGAPQSIEEGGSGGANWNKDAECSPEFTTEMEENGG